MSAAQSASLKPWPKEAVIIVCPFPETANVVGMESVNPGFCRDCRRPVVYDGYTMRRCQAMDPAILCGRPAELLCLECFPSYDFRQVTYFEDHRGHPLAESREGRSS
jgi:hypothetical protein